MLVNEQGEWVECTSSDITRDTELPVGRKGETIQVRGGGGGRSARACVRACDICLQARGQAEGRERERERMRERDAETG